ncbi:MAG: YopX family protein [Parcubacteria group bacterium]
MRELKFRAWDGKKIMYGIMPVDEHRAVNSNPRDQKAFLHGNFIYMQYIGLKDKNGKEIYEGDILDHGYYFQTEAEVVWRDGMFLTKELGMSEEKFIEECVHTHEECMTFLCKVRAEEMMVIGNIYENPGIA